MIPECQYARATIISTCECTVEPFCQTFFLSLYFLVFLQSHVANVSKRRTHKRKSAPTDVQLTTNKQFIKTQRLLI